MLHDTDIFLSEFTFSFIVNSLSANLFRLLNQISIHQENKTNIMTPVDFVIFKMIFKFKIERG